MLVIAPGWWGEEWGEAWGEQSLRVVDAGEPREQRHHRAVPLGRRRRPEVERVGQDRREEQRVDEVDSLLLGGEAVPNVH